MNCLPPVKPVLLILHYLNPINGIGKFLKSVLKNVSHILFTQRTVVTYTYVLITSVILMRCTRNGLSYNITLIFSAQKVLGRGEFGEVFEGNFKTKAAGQSHTISVAIKNAQGNLVKSILTEIKLLSYIGKHPNIVSMIGASVNDLRKRRGIAEKILFTNAKLSLECAKFSSACRVYVSVTLYHKTIYVCIMYM